MFLRNEDLSHRDSKIAGGLPAAHHLFPKSCLRSNHSDLGLAAFQLKNLREPWPSHFSGCDGFENFRGVGKRYLGCPAGLDWSFELGMGLTLVWVLGWALEIQGLM